MQDCTKRNVSTETKLRFHVFQDERFVDLNLYQYGWEQTEPLHSYGPYARNHYLFHYVISGKCTSTTTIHGRDLDNRTDTALLYSRYTMEAWCTCSFCFI